jgi:chondroitin 4-sulfotransferase 11
MKMTVIGSDFLFIHVPKCAGKSVSRRLGGVTKGVPSHAPLSYFDQSVLINRFSFGFVRNPWDRMVSAYSFIISKTPRPLDDADHRRFAIEVGFKRWLTEGSFYLAEELTWPSPPKDCFQRRSQMYWLEGCDYIGRTESIDYDMNVIDTRIARSKSLIYRLLYAGKVAKRNITKRGHYQRYYDAETYDFIAKHFAPEISMFKYRFELD